MTGTERLYGPPLKAAHLLHARVKERTGLNCSIGISRARMVAKVASDQAKPNGILWVLPGVEAAFLAPLDVRRIPGVGKVTEERLHRFGVRKVRDLARLDESYLEAHFGKWGLALAGKSKGEDAGGWFDSEIGAAEDPKSISHEHTFDVDTADANLLDATLARLSSMVARRLREHGLYTRTVQLKLRFKDFTTLTRARTLDHATQLDLELLETVRLLFRANWKPGALVRLLGVHAGSLEPSAGQLSLLEPEKSERWQKALEAADRLRDRYGESAVSLGSAVKGAYRERTHENPASLPGKEPRRER
jgi:DNA polymerase-4